MRNYEAILMWASTVNLDKSIDELAMIKQKYPWLKMPEITKTMLQMSEDIPKIVNIAKHQEKQNAIHRQFYRVSAIADEAIIRAVADKMGYDINELPNG